MDAAQKKKLLSIITDSHRQQIDDLSMIVARNIRQSVFDSLCSGIKANAEPTVIFTAGAPANGKSETVNHLLSQRPETVHIDPDEFGGLFPYYDGVNASDYQKPCTHVMSHCFKQAIRGSFDLIHDTNFAHAETAVRNISEALKKGYFVQIMYVYLDPVTAWKHAQRRERKIEPEIFCRNFIQVRETIKAVLAHPDFKGQPLACSAFVYAEVTGQDKFSRTFHPQITADTLDKLVPFNYSSSDLAEIAV